MSVFTISDLHLSFSSDKSMTVFRGWENYTERIELNWRRVVGENDTVILPGDISWALKIEQALEDFNFIDSLPGKKIILKGNHDLWWSTKTKVNKFFEENKIKSVSLLFNDAVAVEDYVVCGTRGWLYDENVDNKIRLREAGRLRASLEAADRLALEKLVFMHYPFAYGEYICDDILDILKSYNINRVFCGHIHGSGFSSFVNECQGIKIILVSADTLSFTPLLIK